MRSGSTTRRVSSSVKGPKLVVATRRVVSCFKATIGIDRDPIDLMNFPRLN